jgi:hypothetical protein
MKRSFPYRGAEVWNELPAEIQAILKRSKFKSALKKHLIHDYEDRTKCSNTCCPDKLLCSLPKMSSMPNHVPGASHLWPTRWCPKKTMYWGSVTNDWPAGASQHSFNPRTGSWSLVAGSPVPQSIMFSSICFFFFTLFSLCNAVQTI